MIAGSSCSTACPVIFKCDPSACEETPDRANPEMRPDLAKRLFDLLQCHVRSGLALGRASPVSRSRWRQRIALDALTAKRAAASRQDIPPAIDDSTRLRRSVDSALAMSAGLPIPGRQLESDQLHLGNLEASVRSRDSGDTKRSDRDLIEAGLN